MASLDMQGPFDLTDKEINRLITTTSAGNYALGSVDAGGVFRVGYIGRSDTDLNARLKSHVGTYSKFKFSLATSAKAAFDKECKNFHDFGGTEKLKNDIHPDRPKDAGWKCLHCTAFA